MHRNHVTTPTRSASPKWLVLVVGCVSLLAAGRLSAQVVVDSPSDLDVQLIDALRTDASAREARLRQTTILSPSVVEEQGIPDQAPSGWTSEDPVLAPSSAWMGQPTPPGECRSCIATGSPAPCGCLACAGSIAPAAGVPCPRVTTLNPYFNINVFGALKLDMLFNGARSIAPGTPFFLTPGPLPGFEQGTFDMHARQSTIGAAFAGPQVGNFQTGGTMIAMFYNDAVIVDQYGFLPLQAYGDLTSDRWRFAAGLQFDVFSPGIPTVLPFSALAGSGNAGNSFRGQVRMERFVRPGPDRQWTFQFALSEPTPSTIDPAFRLFEDNGWPNLEARVALGCGALPTTPQARRPLEVGLSAVLGELRTTTVARQQVTTDVWGLCADFYWQGGPTWGVAGELFTGQGLGTYNAGILQNLDPDTFLAVETRGGWCELFKYWAPNLHSHCGYGLDNPQNDQVGTNGRTRNETYFANLIWDINPTIRVAQELTWRETEYFTLLNNEGMGFHTQFQWAF